MQEDKKIGYVEMQQLQTELLIEIDRFCTKNSIKYFLAYGTLLGAVRHGGHIPWDDDSDVAMPRPDFERFLREYNESENYRVITYRDDEGLLYNFARIINKKTVLSVGKNVTHGINVDIYPIEGLPSSANERQRFLNKIYRRLHLQNFLIRAHSGFKIRGFNVLSSVLLYLTKFVCKDIDRMVSKYDYHSSDCVAHIVGEPNCKIFPKSIFETGSVMFDAKQFSAPLKTETFLTIVYNDFMKLPPEDKRVPYHGGVNYYWK